MARYTICKIEDLRTNIPMKKAILGGMPVSVYTPTDLVIGFINCSSDTAVSPIDQNDIWEEQVKFTVKLGYGLMFKSSDGGWLITSAIKSVNVLDNGSFEITTKNSKYLVEMYDTII